MGIQRRISQQQISVSERFDARGGLHPSQLTWLDLLINDHCAVPSMRVLYDETRDIRRMLTGPQSDL